MKKKSLLKGKQLEISGEGAQTGKSLRQKIIFFFSEIKVT